MKQNGKTIFELTVVQIDGLDGLDGLSATQILECTVEQGGLVLNAWMAPEVSE